jgi:hypothetical protein
MPDPAFPGVLRNVRESTGPHIPYSTSCRADTHEGDVWHWCTLLPGHPDQTDDNDPAVHECACGHTWPVSTDTEGATR